MIEKGQDADQNEHKVKKKSMGTGAWYRVEPLRYMKVLMRKSLQWREWSGFPVVLDELISRVNDCVRVCKQRLIGQNVYIYKKIYVYEKYQIIHTSSMLQSVP
jgi:hypothetical protein